MFAHADGPWLEGGWVYTDDEGPSDTTREGIVDGNVLLAFLDIIGGNSSASTFQIRKVYQYSCSPMSAFKLNGTSAVQPYVCPGTPIVVDGSPSTCAGLFWISIMKSNASWASTGPEYGRWLNYDDYAKYGAISQFDLRKFFADYGQSFSSGYYRVKVAVGNPWNETTKLMYIPPACPIVDVD